MIRHRATAAGMRSAMRWGAALLLVLSGVLSAQASLYERLAALSSDPHVGEPGRHRCGFPLILEAQSDPAMAAVLEEHRATRLSKTAEVYFSPSGRFRITYERSGFNAIPDYDRNGDGRPDYLDFLGTAFDRAWAIEIDQLGFRRPRDDGGDPLPIYEVFVEGLGTGSYGFTDFSGRPDIPTLPGENHSSVIVINADFSWVDYPGVSDAAVRDSMAIAVTAAHEFFHAIQLTYRIWRDNQNNISDLRLLERTAMLFEEIVADEVNDYYYVVPSFYRFTTLPFDNDRVLYGDVVFSLLLAERHGVGYMRTLWEALAAAQEPISGLAVLDDVLRDRNSSFDGELNRLAQWMFFSGSRAIAGSYFPEGAFYPDVTLAESDPLTDPEGGPVTVFEGTLPQTAFQYLRTDVVPASRVSLRLVPGSEIGAWRGATFRPAAGLVDPFPAGVFAVAAGGDPQERVFTAVVSGMRTTTGFDFSLEMGATVEAALVFPNPVRADVSQVTFANLTPGSRVEIFTANGVRVISLRPEAGLGRVFWDLRNEAGRKVGSGVYLYRILGDDADGEGKLMVIR